MSSHKKDRVETLTLKPSECKNAIKLAILAKKPVFLWGPPGIGKSSILRQIAEELGMDFLDVRLSQMSPDDIKGIPFPFEEEDGVKRVRWIPPYFMPKDENARVLILLDEMNAATPSVQVASYQLVLDRRLGEHVLPEGCVIIAAGNRETDKGVTYRMPSPLVNRFLHVEMRVDFEDWQSHALSQMYHRDVVGFLTFQKGKLFEFDPKTASRGFPTPRSWQFVSDILYAEEKYGSIGEQELLSLIAGCVGDGIAIEFFEYRRITSQLPNIGKILTGEISNLDFKEISVMYALVTGLCYELKILYKEKFSKVYETNKEKKKEWNKLVNNFLTFIMDNTYPEMVILGIRTFMSIYDLPLDPDEVAVWPKFTEQYRDLILS